MSTDNLQRQEIYVITAEPRTPKVTKRKTPQHLHTWVTLKVAAEACGISKQGFINEYVNKGCVKLATVDGLVGYLISRSDLEKIVAERREAGYSVRTTIHVRGTK